MSSRPQVLLAAEVSLGLTAALERDYEVHKVNAPEEARVLNGLAGAIQALVVNGQSRVTAEVFEALPNLGIVSVFGVGYAGVDVQAAAARRVHVTNTPDVLTDDVADLAIGLTIAVVRQVCTADQFLRAGQWMEGSFPLTPSLTRKRLGLFGMGRIGQAIARRAEAMGMTIAYHSRRQVQDLPYQYYSNLIELASATDILVVAAPGTPQTAGAVSDEVLAALGAGYLVNVGRGSIVDEGALVRALRTTLKGAALDVFGSEPNRATELSRMPNVVLTPHIGSATVNSRNEMARLVLENLDAHFHGRPLVTPVPS